VMCTDAWIPTHVEILPNDCLRVLPGSYTAERKRPAV